MNILLQPKHDVGERFWTMYANKPREVEITFIFSSKVMMQHNPDDIRKSVIYTLSVLNTDLSKGRHVTSLENYTDEKIDRECFKTKEECIKSLY